MTTPTAAELRAEIARRGLKQYVLAAYVRMGPGILRAYLNERRALTPEIAQQIGRAIPVAWMIESVRRKLSWP